MFSAGAKKIGRYLFGAVNSYPPEDEVGAGVRDPKVVVAEAEARTAKIPGKEKFASNRTRARELHREADQLYLEGDYESALILYHKAGRLRPNGNEHAAAARRAEVAISSAIASSGNREITGTKAEPRERAGGTRLCPRIVTERAKDTIALRSTDLDEEVPRILRYFDAHKDYRGLFSARSVTPRRTGTRPMQRQLDICIKSTAREVEEACHRGDCEAVVKLGEELISLVSLVEESRRKEIAAYDYLVTKQMTLGRHDRAIDLASKMLFLARTNGDSASEVDALLAVGRVHLAFGHLDALVKVWERLVDDLTMVPMAQSWLYHDIGRCHLELGADHRALEAAKSCLKLAERAKSKKWILRGRLLTGQSFLKLGKLAEAVSSLKLAGNLAQEEEEQSILLYVQELIDQVTRFLRRLNQQREGLMEFSRDSERLHEDVDEKSQDQDNKLGLIPAGTKRSHRATSPPAAATTELLISNENLSKAIPTTIGRLLERTRALRPNGDKSSEATLSGLSADASDLVATDPSSETPRTRVTTRTSSLDLEEEEEEEEEKEEEEETLVPGKSSSLSDTSNVELTEERSPGSTSRFSGQTEHGWIEKGSSSEMDSPAGGTQKDSRDNTRLDKEDEFFSRAGGSTCPNFAYNLDSETQPVEMSLNPTVQLANGLSDYLKSLEPRDFEEFLAQEQSFFDGRSSQFTGDYFDGSLKNRCRF